VIVVQDVGPRRTGQLRAGDDPEGEQQQLEAAEDEPARAGDHLARCASSTVAVVNTPPAHESH
jgi:hypothetical protein